MFFTSQTPDSLRINPKFFLLAIGIYLLGDVTGIVVNNFIWGAWLAALPNYIDIPIVVVLTVLYLQQRVPHTWLINFVCTAGFIIFNYSTLFWFFHKTQDVNAWLMISLAASIMFSSVIGAYSSKLLFGVLIVLADIEYTTLSFILNTKTTIPWAMIMAPAVLGYGAIIIGFRQSVEEIFRKTTLSSTQKKSFNLADKGISATEYRAIKLCMEGKSSREIADIECVTISAINNRFSSIFFKLGVINRLQLIQYLGDFEWIQNAEK